MLPTETAAVEKQKINLFFYINEMFLSGLKNFKRNTDRYCENFK